MMKLSPYNKLLLDTNLYLIIKYDTCNATTVYCQNYNKEVWIELNIPFPSNVSKNIVHINIWYCALVYINGLVKFNSQIMLNLEVYSKFIVSL